MIDGVGEIDVIDLLEEIGISNVHEVGRGEVGFSCPSNDGHTFGDSNPSAHMNRSAPHPFRCKGCGWTGTAFSLVGSVLKLSPVETTRWLRDRYGDGYREPKGGRVSEEMRIWDQSRLERQSNAARGTHISLSEDETIGERGILYMDWNCDQPAAEYMRGRGFQPEFLAARGYGFDSWTNRITIPIRDEIGRLIGFKGRAVSDAATPKYLILGDSADRRLRYGIGYGFEMYDPRKVIFGLDQVPAEHLGSVELVVCEGELNADFLRQHKLEIGAENPVAIGTTTITHEQQRLLRWYATSIILFYESDQGGFDATWGYVRDDKSYPGLVEKLSPYLRIKIAPDHEGDPASIPVSESRDLIRRAQSWMAIAVE